MKKLLIATALLASTSLANAADLSRAISPPVIDTWSWGGFYVGALLGGGWGNTDNTAAGGGFSVDMSSRNQGVMAGGYAGYNVQFGHMVVGLESDLAWTNLRGSVDANGHFDATIGSVPWAARVDNRLTWLGSTRGRVGYAFGSFLPYATGGLAYGGTQVDAVGVVGASSVNSSLAQSFSGSDTRLGWAAGAGLEYAFGNMLARVEYLHFDLGTSNYTVIADPEVTLSTHHRGDTVRAGVGFKF